MYLRLPMGRTIDDIPADTLEDCAQLVKANSISGNKATCVDIVYTPWANLKKTASMEVGQARSHSVYLGLTVREHATLNKLISRQVVCAPGPT